MVATNTANADRLFNGRMIVTSVTAPRAKPNSMPMSVESSRGTPWLSNHHTTNTDSVPISPWAKLRCPVPR